MRNLRASVTAPHRRLPLRALITLRLSIPISSLPQFQLRLLSLSPALIRRLRKKSRRSLRAVPLSLQLRASSPLSSVAPLRAKKLRRKLRLRPLRALKSLLAIIKTVAISVHKRTMLRRLSVLKALASVALRMLRIILKIRMPLRLKSHVIAVVLVKIRRISLRRLRRRLSSLRLVAKERMPRKVLSINSLKSRVLVALRARLRMPSSRKSVLASVSQRLLL